MLRSDPMNDVKRVMKLAGLTRIQAQAFLGRAADGYYPTDTDEEVVIMLCRKSHSVTHTAMQDIQARCRVAASSAKGSAIGKVA